MLGWLKEGSWAEDSKPNLKMPWNHFDETLNQNNLVSVAV